MAFPDLILASKSKARIEMLEGAKLFCLHMAADIDETSIKERAFKAGKSPREIALLLAQEKAFAISKTHPEALVIGSDQILEFEGKLISKSSNPQEAIEKLKLFSGKTHQLISAVCVVQNNQVLWHNHDQATLTMRPLTDEFLYDYQANAGAALTASVGGYWLEDIGCWLFEKIAGNHYTILGMPLLPLVSYLYDTHSIYFKNPRYS